MSIPTFCPMTLKRSDTHTVALCFLTIVVERQDGIVLAQHSVRLGICLNIHLFLYLLAYLIDLVCEVLSLLIWHHGTLIVEVLTLINSPFQLFLQILLHVGIVDSIFLYLLTIFNSLKQPIPRVVVVNKHRHFRLRSTCGNSLQNHRLLQFYGLLVVIRLFYVSCHCHTTADFLYRLVRHIGQVSHLIEDTGILRSRFNNQIVTIETERRCCNSV